MLKFTNALHFNFSSSAFLTLFFLFFVITGESMASDTDTLKQEVIRTELAFAQSMADRDLKAFSEFIAEDTVFLGGSALRGKKAVVDAWSAYFTDPDAPFAWKPETVEVLEDGQLALSTGPVWNDNGQFAIFTSIWRRNDKGEWRIIFDRGNKYCPPQDGQ